MIWLVHLIYSAVGFALCYNYVILNYCIRFAVLPCVRLCLNSCYYNQLSLDSTTSTTTIIGSAVCADAVDGDGRYSDNYT